MSTYAPECSGVEAYPGKLVVWRAWSSHPPLVSSVRSPLNLYSTAMDFAWEQEVTAGCLRSSGRCPCADCIDAGPGEPHQAPHTPCVCGIYAWHDEVAFLRYCSLRPSFEPLPGTCGGAPCGWFGWMAPNVIGAVEIWGRVLVGTKGVRAQHARVLAVSKVRNAGPEALGVPVISVETLRAEYPISDLSWAGQGSTKSEEKE